MDVTNSASKQGRVRPTVLVLDEGFMSGAYAALGLRDAGCRVVVLAGTGGRGLHSGRRITWLLGPHLSSNGFLAMVDDIVRKERIDIVYPVTEPIQRAVWNANPPWAAMVFPQTAPWQRELYNDKARMSERECERGVSVPASRIVASDDQVRDAIAALGMPVVVKGVRGRGGNAVWITETPNEVMQRVRLLRSAGIPCFLQRYIVGATYLVGGVFREGEPLRLYAGRKVEQYPPRTGPSIRIQSTDDPALVDTALKAFRVASITGLASADFILDDEGREGERDRFLFLELNPRPWGSISAAAESDVELFAPLAELIDGHTPTADLRFRAGVDSTVLPLYLRSPSFWRASSVIGALIRDLRGVAGAPWREPGQAAHLLNRLHRVARNWGTDT